MERQDPCLTASSGDLYAVNVSPLPASASAQPASTMSALQFPPQRACSPPRPSFLRRRSARIHLLSLLSLAVCGVFASLCCMYTSALLRDSSRVSPSASFASSACPSQQSVSPSLAASPLPSLAASSLPSLASIPPVSPAASPSSAVSSPLSAGGLVEFSSPASILSYPSSVFSRLLSKLSLSPATPALFSRQADSPSAKAEAHESSLWTKLALENFPEGSWRARVQSAAVIVKRQVAQQIRKHQPELRRLVQGLLQMFFQCLRSFLGVYILGLSVLILPFCASSASRFEAAVNRVPLNDPYLLSQLDLPEDASPSLFGLSHYDVTIAPVPPAQLSALYAEGEGKGGSDRARAPSKDGAPPAFAAGTRESAPQELPTADLRGPEAEAREARARGTAGTERATATDGRRHGIADGNLRGWWIPAEDRNSKKAVLCAHGWLANRQACLPFLGVAKKVGLHKDHHFLLFDLMNSGESSRLPECALEDGTAGCTSSGEHSADADGPCSGGRSWSFFTAVDDAGDALLGCQAAKDLIQALLWMKTHGISTVSIYAQGVSAMGTMLLVGQYREHLERAVGIKIDRVVFDSPICNARDAVAKQPMTACIAKTAKWLHDVLMWAVNQRRGQELRRMRASLLLPASQPLRKLVLTSREDDLAPWETVEKEMMLLPEADRPEWTCVFPSGAHCDLIRTNPEAYSQVLRAFYSDPSFLGRLWEKIVGKRAPVSALSGVEALGPHDFTLCAEREEREREKREREKDKALEAETRAKLGRKKLAIAAAASVLDVLSSM
ncbi:conserved hypothetical protein [Neospora caninum Liverpool]|uniref:Transmembrane protein n=1 Tax=Neospora caninum (strain Liverpool) TaxID=572307 RepID=F0VCP4_NEOCL|nr:conserved hypothetical protein [Neospora caninum Liverpool]CBZ51733.1 conserved hypothetical protein [Neospora caninum Liverpool]CEL65689.1 TPA: hypothetical protein BN1204_015260 [Neospora caninum Liverpool]|eukprot:XP_003881766.1 conserved hypothetical protein [Neospora caninum Liverpool]